MIKVIKLIIVSSLLSACMIKWEMKLDINEDLSGTYSLTAGIDEELQIFALEMVQSSLGGLDSVLDSVPDGYGKSFYSDDIYDGITIRNSFKNIEEFNKQLDTLRENPDTALMLIPMESINIDKEIVSTEAKYRVYGEFAEIIASEVTDSEMDIPQMEYLYDLSLVITLPGKMLAPIEINNGDNTVIFEPNGREKQTFEAVSLGEGGLSSRYDLITVASLLFVAMLATLFIRKKASQ